MKKYMLALSCATLLLQADAFAQRSCGAQQLHQAMIANDPSWAQKLEDQRNSLQADADKFIAEQARGASQKTSATISAIPVIFHIVVDSTQFRSLGSTAGIIKRCDSQIAVLNRDFNRKNLDSNLIPASWKALFGNAGISFGLARRTPEGDCTPGYEIKIIPTTGYSNVNQAFPEAKTAATGLDAWDVTKYYNVWCVNFTGSASSLLGITLPKGSTNSTTIDQEGVVILYNTLGKTTTGAGSFPSQYNLGRTLTHETGHFFEIWHTWGDDGGACPGTGGGDDGLSDTPPEFDAIYGNPAYTITGGTFNDSCRLHDTTNVQPIGIACLSYMDYTDDNAMHLFTPMQAAAMASKVISASGENHNLTQNPDLLLCPEGITKVEADGGLNIFPNPSSGTVNISFNAAQVTLKQITIMNMVGQKVAEIAGSQKDFYSINLSGMSKGIYFVTCNFASGSVTRKILLQ